MQALRQGFYGQDKLGFGVTRAAIAAFTAAQVDDARYVGAFLLATLSGRRKYILLMLVLVPLLMSYIIKIYRYAASSAATAAQPCWSGLGLIDEPPMIFVFNLNAVLLDVDECC